MLRGCRPGCPTVLPPVDFATLDLLPYGIIVTDRRGTILYYNRREEEIAQRQREDVVGKNFFTDVAPCTQVREFQHRFERTVAGESVAAFRFVFPFPAGPRTVEISLTGFDHETSRLCLIAVNDKTEEDRVRTEILQGERFRELGEVAAGVAHNFNNLLTIVRGNADLMLEATADPEFQAQCRDIIKAASDGAALVKRVRQTVGGAPLGEAPPVAINAIVEDAVSAIRRTLPSGISLGVETSPAVGAARVAPSELREAIFNLLRNALDATEGRDAPDISVSTAVSGRRVTIAVSDNGSGMSPDVQRRLFQPLFTTKGARGTGLGLASSLALMRRYGGMIEVNSVEGTGSEITISLPHLADPAV